MDVSLEPTVIDDKRLALLTMSVDDFESLETCLDRDNLAALIQRATEILAFMDVPTINEHEVVAEGRPAPPKGKP